MALVLLSQLAGAGTAFAYTRHLEARLSGTSNYSYARGHAEYGSCCGDRHFDVQMWNMGGLKGTTLVVFAAGHKIGPMRVGSNGRCHLHRDTRHGQKVPTLSNGDMVSIRASGGALVASGRLHRMMM